MKQLFFLLTALFIITSCAEVDNGYKGVVYKPYSGGLDPTNVLEEGVSVGLSWLWNDLIEYDCRQKTTNIETALLDVNNMDVPITASVFHRVIPNQIGRLHLDKGKTYIEDYIVPVTEGALKSVVGKYTAQELVSSRRTEAQAEIKNILVESFAANYIQCDDIIIRDIDLPQSITAAIEAKQVQDERNLLAEKTKLEEENLAAARIAKAKGDAEAAKFDAEAKRYLSTPSVLKLKELEIQLEWARKGVSPYGNNNVFGEGVSVIRGLNLSGGK